MPKSGRGGRPLFRPLTVVTPTAPSSGDEARTCGSCTACCVPFVIEELDKPGGVPCVHLRPDGGGCGRYHTRPEPCRRFECLWLRGLVPEAMRPDRVGYLVSTDWSGSFLQVDELTPGATEGCPHFGPWADEVRLRGIPVLVLPAAGGNQSADIK
jgi:hypothetical protein